MLLGQPRLIERGILHAIPVGDIVVPGEQGIESPVAVGASDVVIQDTILLISRCIVQSGVSTEVESRIHLVLDGAVARDRVNLVIR